MHDAISPESKHPGHQVHFHLYRAEASWHHLPKFVYSLCQGVPRHSALRQSRTETAAEQRDTEANKLVVVVCMHAGW